MTPICTNTQINLRLYKTILKKTIRAAKLMYYQITFNKYKYNIRNTWNTINEIISRPSKNDSFLTFFIDGQTKLTENLDIANKFNAFFTNVGPNLASNIIYTGDKTHKTYLSERHDVEIQLYAINETKIS